MIQEFRPDQVQQAVQMSAKTALRPIDHSSEESGNITHVGGTQLLPDSGSR